MGVNPQLLQLKFVDGYTLNIPLSYAITVIFDQGCTGKSYIFRQLQVLKERCQLSNNILLINRLNAIDCEWVTKLRDVFVVIDDWELVMARYPKIVDILNTQQYKCLIFGRDIDMLRINRDYAFRLAVDLQRKAITVKSVFN